MVINHGILFSQKIEDAEERVKGREVLVPYLDSLLCGYFLRSSFLFVPDCFTLFLFTFGFSTIDAVAFPHVYGDPCPFTHQKVEIQQSMQHGYYCRVIRLFHYRIPESVALGISSGAGHILQRRGIQSFFWGGEVVLVWPVILLEWS